MEDPSLNDAIRETLAKLKQLQPRGLPGPDVSGRGVLGALLRDLEATLRDVVQQLPLCRRTSRGLDPLPHTLPEIRRFSAALHSLLGDSNRIPLLGEHGVTPEFVKFASRFFADALARFRDHSPPGGGPARRTAEWWREWARRSVAVLSAGNLIIRRMLLAAPSAAELPNLVDAIVAGVTLTIDDDMS